MTSEPTIPAAIGPRTCSIEGCARTHEARGWCKIHYLRWHRHGDPNIEVTPAYATPEEALAARTEPQGNCLIWTGGLDASGYGSITTGGRRRPAHRVAWEIANGPIPDGLVMDHVCRNRACVRIEHLRTATAAQNTWNRYTDPGISGVRGVKVRRYGFEARVAKDGVRRSVLCETLEEATEAVNRMRMELHGEYAGPSSVLPSREMQGVES